MLDLVLTMCAELGIDSDRELASLAGVSVETVNNWRSGAVSELKPQKLAAVKAGLSARIAALKERAAISRVDQLCRIEVEEGSGPADIQRQFRARVDYDYLGHRFLYFDPQGAIAWEMLIKAGYEQERWLLGVQRCADEWLTLKKDRRGRAKGPIARMCHLDQRAKERGLDVICLGPGEGGKETLLLRKMIDQSFAWLSYSLIDVSIPLLLKASRGCHELADNKDVSADLMSFCADFEEGSLKFLERLPTERHPDAEGLRLVVMLGNTFGNLRDEESFVRQKLRRLARPGDLVWIEVGLRPEKLTDEPLFRLTQENRQNTATEMNRIHLLTGPYRRWEAQARRPPADLGMRVVVREDDDSSRVPGSCNFCHDLVIEEEQRACTMLFSRRYTLEGLTAWFEDLDFTVERIIQVEDARRRPRVAHLLLRRA